MINLLTLLVDWCGDFFLSFSTIQDKFNEIVKRETGSNSLLFRDTYFQLKDTKESPSRRLLLGKLLGMNGSKMALSPLRMDTSNKKTVLHHTSTNERVRYLNSTANSTLLYYYQIILW